jgi:hypothetical protein
LITLRVVNISTVHNHHYDDKKKIKGLLFNVEESVIFESAICNF